MVKGPIAPKIRPSLPKEKTPDGEKLRQKPAEQGEVREDKEEDYDKDMTMEDEGLMGNLCGREGSRSAPLRRRLSTKRLASDDLVPETQNDDFVLEEPGAAGGESEVQVDRQLGNDLPGAAPP